MDGGRASGTNLLDFGDSPDPGFLDWYQDPDLEFFLLISYSLEDISSSCCVVIFTRACVMRRTVRKEKRKEQRRRKVETGVDVGPSRKALKSNMMKNSRCEITVAVDLSFDDLMSEKVLIVVFVTLCCHSDGNKAEQMPSAGMLKTEM